MTVRSFYAYWEHEIFTSLVEFVARNLCQFFENMFGSVTFFTADVLLAPPRIKLQPSLGEIINSIQRSAHGISELPKQFTRWLHGSCLPCPSTPVLDENIDAPDFTFYNDIKRHPDVVSLTKSVRSNASGLATAINRTLTRLLVYNDLWKSDKQKLTHRFTTMSRTLTEYDDMMKVFSRLDHIFDRALPTENLYSVQLSFKELYQALRHHCQEWLQHYGQHLHRKTSIQLKEINDRLDYFAHGLRHDADTVPDLKYVLNIIAQINQEQEPIGHAIHHIEQSYRILREHHYAYPPSDGTLLQTFVPRLHELSEQSRLVEHRLKHIRERFREIVQYDIDLFQRIVNELTDRFNTHGPHTVQNDLNRMFVLLKQFQNDVAKTEQRKTDLFNAMKLFHIPVIQYPDLIRLQTEINGLQLLANLYEDFKRNERLWSNILWSELNINELMNSVDAFVKQFRHLPQPVKTTAVGHAVEKYLTGTSLGCEPRTTVFDSDFRSSLPIMADLKSEALRERHWRQILQETNLDADLTNNVLTLENIFQMNLYQYNDVIQGNPLLLETEQHALLQRFYKRLAKNCRSKSISKTSNSNGTPCAFKYTNTTGRHSRPVPLKSVALSLPAWTTSCKP